LLSSRYLYFVCSSLFLYVDKSLLHIVKPPLKVSIWPFFSLLLIFDFYQKIDQKSTFSIPITIPTYHISIPTYQHITYPHTNIPHTTYQHTTIYLIPYYLYCLEFVFCPNFCVCQYSIILPKNYTIIKIQKYFVKLKFPNEWHFGE
jgi:hypothetical protein